MAHARPLSAPLLARVAAAAPVRGDELAFITAQSPLNAVLVDDVATMTERTRVTGLGIEPSRMVANSDRSRLYLVSRVTPPACSPPRCASTR